MRPDMGDVWMMLAKSYARNNRRRSEPIMVADQSPVSNCVRVTKKPRTAIAAAARQSGDVKQAPGETPQSVIAQRIPPMTPIGTDKELIVRLRKYGHIEAADALLSRIAEVERLTALVAEMDKQVDDCCGCLGHVEPEFRARIDAALSQHGKV